MTRRNAFRQCDVERALRAAKATGAGRVEIYPDGVIRIEPEPAPQTGLRPPTKREEYVL